MSVPRYHALRVAAVEPETADALCVAFEVPPELAAAYRYTQGQHLGLRVRDGGEELRRSYSICDGIGEGGGLLHIAIRLVPGGRFSRWVAEHLRPGARIDVLTPDGGFFTPLAPAARRHHVAFAAGSGITPILSLARSTLAHEPRARFTLVYGNRGAASVMFREALEDLKDRHLDRFVVLHVFSREERDVALLNGRIDRAKVAALIATLIPAASIDEAFVCGPGTMIDEVRAALLAAGVAPEHLHSERFGDAAPGAAAGAPAVAPAAAAAARVVIVLDGLRREFPFAPGHGTILGAGRAAGIELPFSCAGGMCGTCRARLLEGEVRMQRNFALEQRDLDAGFVLTCQSYPLSARVLLNFDAR